MGCSPSKRIEADVYRPAPSSFAVFDINSIEEPWLKATAAGDSQALNQDKPTHVPSSLLEKLNAIEDAPRSWDEVSKALESLKPTLNNPPPPSPPPPPPPPPPVEGGVTATATLTGATPAEKKNPSKSLSFHTLEELDAKLTSKSPTELSSKKTELRKSESVKTELTQPRVGLVAPPPGSNGYNSVKETIFVVRDRLEREKEGKAPILVKRDPLSEFPDMCPPSGVDSVVLYTTSLGGVRRTYEDCNRVRTILEAHRVVFDERDISLHGGFLNELKELLGEGVSVPRMFVKGRYVGGVEEVVSLNETSRLGKILSSARVERGVGRQACEGCGGARFVPCLDCGGSCKVLVGDKKERCGKCNENGLVHCPSCI